MRLSLRSDFQTLISPQTGRLPISLPHRMRTTAGPASASSLRPEGSGTAEPASDPAPAPAPIWKLFRNTLPLMYVVVYVAVRLPKKVTVPNCAGEMPGRGIDQRQRRRGRYRRRD